MPTFKTLKPGTLGPADEGAVLSEKDVAPEDRALRLAFNVLTTPTNGCELLKAGEGQAMVDDMQRLANCLFDSWRPVAESQGIELPRLKVVLCTTPQVHEGCTTENATMVAHTDGTIGVVLPLFSVSDEYRLNPSLLIGHEVAHMLQHFMVKEKDRYALLTGVIDQNYYRKTRRQELQAHCLGIAMIGTSTPLTFDILDNNGMTNGSDLIHGDAKAHTFWAKQALSGKVGECNTMVADNSLLTAEGL